MIAATVNRRGGSLSDDLERDDLEVFDAQPRRQRASLVEDLRLEVPRALRTQHLLVRAHSLILVCER